MGVKPGIKNKKQQDQSAIKCATSEDCNKCADKCIKGIKFLKKLECKGISNCPICPLK